MPLFKGKSQAKPWHLQWAGRLLYQVCATPLQGSQSSFFRFTLSRPGVSIYTLASSAGWGWGFRVGCGRREAGEPFLANQSLQTYCITYTPPRVWHQMQSQPSHVGWSSVTFLCSCRRDSFGSKGSQEIAKWRAGRGRLGFYMFQAGTGFLQLVSLVARGTWVRIVCPGVWGMSRAVLIETGTKDGVIRPGSCKPWSSDTTLPPSPSSQP